MIRTLIVCLLSLATVYGQVNQRNPQLPPDSAFQETYRPYVDGSNRIIYECVALQNSGRSVFALTANLSSQPKRLSTAAVVTLVSIADSSTTSTITFSGAHGLAIGDSITIAAATTDTDLNGTYEVATVPGSTTVTITTASVTDATYTDATMTVETTAPRGVDLVWSIRKYFYTSTNTIPDQIRYLRNSLLGLACDSRASY